MPRAINPTPKAGIDWMERKARSMVSTACLTVLSCLTVFGAPAAFAGNLMQEQRLSEQLAQATLTGRAEWLEAGPLRFLAILEAARGERRYGGVVLLHDAGEHADWQQVIAPLRHYLAMHGWDALSIQLPMARGTLRPAARQALLTEARPRIQAAVDSLSGRGSDNLALIGHGLGARMALDYLNAKPPASLHAFVAIGLSADGQHEDDPVIAAIGKLALPMLDLYGSRDLPPVIDSAPDRRGAARRSGHKAYRQDRMTGADHAFDGLQSSLQRRVETWLRRTTFKPGQPGGARAPAG
jgi:dienelactone hydrolase